MKEDSASCERVVVAPDVREHAVLLAPYVGQFDGRGGRAKGMLCLAFDVDGANCVEGIGPYHILGVLKYDQLLLQTATRANKRTVAESVRKDGR